MSNCPKLTLTRIDPGPAPCLVCGEPAVWFAEYDGPVDLTLCDACYEVAKGEPDDLDKAVTAMRDMLCADDEESFICTDVDGVEHDLNLNYVNSTREGTLYRIHAGYPPDETTTEEGLAACRAYRSEPKEFLVTEVEHARMRRDGVLDAIEGQDIMAALVQRVGGLLEGSRDN